MAKRAAIIIVVILVVIAFAWFAIYVSQPKRIGVVSGGGSTPTGVSTPTQPVDTSSIRAAVMTTLNGWVEGTKNHNVDTCMSLFADKLDVYYSLKNVSSQKVRSDLVKAFSNYSTLDVQLSNVVITPDASGVTATATFDKTFNFQGQKYYSGTVEQRLWLANVGGRWLITGLKELNVYGTNSGMFSEDDANNASTAPPESKPSAPSPVVVKVYNVDDQATVFVNGIQVLKVPYRGSGEIDVSKTLRSGRNEIRLRVQNFEGCYTYGFEIRQNEETIFSDKCGQVGHPSVGCNNNDYTLGVTYDKTIVVMWQSGTVVSHSVVSPASSRAAQIAPRPEPNRDELSPTGLPNGVPGPPSVANKADQRPLPLNSPTPRYTVKARENKIQGTVMVRVLIGVDGLVKRVIVARGLPDGLDEQAIQAAYQMRFRPAMKDGQPVEFWLPVAIEFNLR